MRDDSRQSRWLAIVVVVLSGAAFAATAMRAFVTSVRVGSFRAGGVGERQIDLLISTQFAYTALIGGAFGLVLGLILASIAVSNRPHAVPIGWAVLNAIFWPVPFALIVTVLCVGGVDLPGQTGFFSVVLGGWAAVAVLFLNAERKRSEPASPRR